MRKIAYVLSENTDNIKKVMLYECSYGVYIFGYDTIYEYPGVFDYLYDSLEDAEVLCFAEYDICDKDWIAISDPQEFCQHDMIMPIRIKGRDESKPIWGGLELFCKGKWESWMNVVEKDQPIGGLTGNERLFACGLMDELDSAKRCGDKEKAKKILEALKFEEPAKSNILQDLTR